MLQAPRGLTARQIAAARRDLDRMVRGLPGDVVLTLASLDLLAEQGNEIAARLFAREVERLGLTKVFYSFRV